MWAHAHALTALDSDRWLNFGVEGAIVSAIWSHKGLQLLIIITLNDLKVEFVQ